MAGGRVWFDRIGILLGVWLILSGFFFRYSEVAMWNAIIVGAAIVLVAGLAVVRRGAGGRWKEWLNFVLGVWLIASPWLLGYAEAGFAAWVHMIVGIIIVIISVVAIRQTPRVL